MHVNENSVLNTEESGPRLLIKQVARRLFAERGIRDVTVREIAEAADQKNRGVVAYYFETKDNLVREILIDGARRIEDRRFAYIRQIESTGGFRSVRHAAEAVVMPSASFSDEDVYYGQNFNRFLFQLSISQPDFLHETLNGRWNVSYQMCLNAMRGMLSHLNRAEQNRRFVFFAAYCGNLLAMREAKREDLEKPHTTWVSPKTLEDIIQTAAALVQADPV